MNKGLYKSSVDKIKFDENLEGKTLNYINERGSKMNNTKKSKWKMKMSASTAVAACTICVLSATAYAAVLNLNNVSHSEYGFVSKESISEESNSKDSLDKFLNTSEIRNKMKQESSDIKLVSEESNVDGVNWVMKSVFKDENKIYTSDDKIKWEADKSQGASLITEYLYSDYEKAIKDAKLPNVMKNILSMVDSNKCAFLEEYSNENKAEISKKRVMGAFDYKKGKISVDLSKYLNINEGENSGYNAISDIEKATNQREYQSKDGSVFKLSDNNNDGSLKTTTMVSSGEFCLIIQFENINDSDIHTILDNLDLTEFGIE
ncbi:MAG: hypothetical protein ACRC3Y_12635 [Romboutsia sp.]|uniref:hypothetical protein n=1 Tax=Romboutsia sp. TaxID=1965302 RepID=UPI003F3A9234